MAKHSQDGAGKNDAVLEDFNHIHSHVAVDMRLDDLDRCIVNSEGILRVNY